VALASIGSISVASKRSENNQKESGIISVWRNIGRKKIWHHAARSEIAISVAPRMAAANSGWQNINGVASIIIS